MGAVLPVLKTKRFLYDVMTTRLNKLDAYAARNNDAYEDSATAILGVRQIGKTVLLKQLYNVAPDISEYRDCTGMPSDFDFDGYLRKLLDSGVKRLFLDEVCKIQRDSLADLIRFIKDACAFMSVTFTGSTNHNWKPQPDLLAELESSKNDNFIYNIQCISAEEFLLNLSKYAGDAIDMTNYFD